MGNIFPSTKKCAFFHRREQLPDRMHRSEGTMMTYDNLVEYCGSACSFEDGNESGGLNFEQYEIVFIERYTRKNIFIDRIQGTAEITAALAENGSGVRPGSKSIKITLQNDQTDVGKVLLLDESKNDLAIFYIDK